MSCQNNVRQTPPPFHLNLASVYRMTPHLSPPRPRHTPPRFANPWRWRRQSRGEALVRLAGGEGSGTMFRRNGVVCFTIVVSGACDGPPTASERSMLPELQRRVAAEIAGYRLSGLFSSKEVGTIVALWQDGVGLRELARKEAVTPQAVADRIQRLEQRAPRFVRWWRLKNRSRDRR
jgi:hypothetical protein